MFPLPASTKYKKGDLREMIVLKIIMFDCPGRILSRDQISRIAKEKYNEQLSKYIIDQTVRNGVALGYPIEVHSLIANEPVHKQYKIKSNHFSTSKLTPTDK